MIDRLRRFVSSRPWLVRAYCVFALLAAPPVLMVAGVVQIFADEWPTFWGDVKQCWRTRKVNP